MVTCDLDHMLLLKRSYGNEGTATNNLKILELVIVFTKKSAIIGGVRNLTTNNYNNVNYRKEVNILLSN